MPANPCLLSSLKALPILITLASAAMMPVKVMADNAPQQNTASSKLIYFDIPADELSKSLNLFSCVNS